MGFQLVVAVDPLRDVDRSVRRAAEEREWLKVAGGSKAHLLEAKSPRDFPISGVELYAGLFFKVRLIWGGILFGFVCLLVWFFLSFFLPSFLSSFLSFFL